MPASIKWSAPSWRSDSGPEPPITRATTCAESHSSRGRRNDVFRPGRRCARLTSLSSQACFRSPTPHRGPSPWPRRPDSEGGLRGPRTCGRTPACGDALVQIIRLGADSKTAAPPLAVAGHQRRAAGRHPVYPAPTRRVTRGGDLCPARIGLRFRLVHDRRAEPRRARPDHRRRLAHTRRGGRYLQRRRGGGSRRSDVEQSKHNTLSGSAFNRPIEIGAPHTSQRP